MNLACVGVAAMALASFALAPAAHGQQSGCPLLQGIVDGAAAGFPELRGDELSEGWFDSTLYMTGSDECSVNVGDSNLFYCVWGFDTPEAADSLATALSNAGRECLAGWTLQDTSGAKSSNNLTILNGLTLSGVGGHAGTRMLVYAESFEGSQESQVTIEVRR